LIEANLGDPIPLYALAARAALSPYHFARAFKTSVGGTPRAFVEQRRIDRVTQLLAESDRSISGIAIDTGFGTQSRLTLVFKRQTGFTPGVCRRGRAGTRAPAADAIGVPSRRAWRAPVSGS
jgi:AraC family transcriptional regulator